jgi:hypothetical protein
VRSTPTLAFALLFALGCFSCPFGPGKEEQAPTTEAGHHGDDFLVWRLDGTRSTTAWVREGDGVVHTRPGIWLGAGGHLWKWGTTQVTTPVLDCGCYDPYDLPPREDLRQARKKSCIRDAQIEALQIQQVDGDRVVAVLAEPPDDGRDPELFEGRVKRSYAPLGAVGKWLFVARREERMACTDSTPTVKWAFATVDLESGASGTMLSPSDLNQVENVEKARAAELLCVAPDCFKPDPAKVRFTAMSPRWSPDLALSLQYTTDAVLGQPDGRWDSGTRSGDVDAAELPTALRPYADTPPAVEAFWPNGAPETGGWTPVDPAMRTLFGG